MSDYIDFKKNIADEKTGYLSCCSVSPDYRSCGVGKIAIEKLLEISQKDYKTIILNSRNKAKSLYKRAGFEELDPSTSLAEMLINKISGENHLGIPMVKSTEKTDVWQKRIMELK